MERFCGWFRRMERTPPLKWDDASAGEGYVADMAEEGEALLIADADDERLTARNFAKLMPEPGASPVTNALVVPLMQDEAEIGVLEAINKEDGVFDDDDQFLMMSMAETDRQRAEERQPDAGRAEAGDPEGTGACEQLRSPPHCASTGCWESLSTARNTYCRTSDAPIALDQRGKAAVEGRLGHGCPALGRPYGGAAESIDALALSQTEILHLRQRTMEGEKQTDIPGPVAEYFAATGFRGLYAIPLADDQGRLGVLTYESSDADFLDVPHIEMIKILAARLRWPFATRCSIAMCR